jgi:tRNA(Ile)-lysidine synthase TilS/MesJ
VNSSLQKNNAIPGNGEGKIVCPLMKIWRMEIGNLCNIVQIKKIWEEDCTDFVKCLPYEFVEEARLFDRFGDGTPCLKIPNDKMPEIEEEIKDFKKRKKAEKNFQQSLPCYHVKDCSIPSLSCNLYHMITICGGATKKKQALDKLKYAR